MSSMSCPCLLSLPRSLPRSLFLDITIFFSLTSWFRLRDNGASRLADDDVDDDDDFFLLKRGQGGVRLKKRACEFKETPSDQEEDGSHAFDVEALCAQNVLGFQGALARQ